MEWLGTSCRRSVPYHRIIALSDARPDAQRAAPWVLDRRHAPVRERTGEHTPKASAAPSGKVTSLRWSIAATANVGTTTTKTHNHGTRRGRNTRSDGAWDRSGWLLLVSSGRLSSFLARRGRVTQLICAPIGSGGSTETANRPAERGTQDRLGIGLATRPGRLAFRLFTAIRQDRDESQWDNETTRVACSGVAPRCQTW